MSVETGWLSEEDWNDPIMEGVLRKKGARGHIRKKWTTRYFRIQNGSMFWFKDQGSKKLKGHIPLDDAVVELNTPKTNTELNCWKLHCKVLDRSYYLSAENQDAVKDWVHAIQSQSRLGLYKQLIKKNESKMFSIPSDDEDDDENHGNPFMAPSHGSRHNNSKKNSNNSGKKHRRNDDEQGSDSFHDLDES